MLEDIAPLGRMASSDEIAAMVAYLGRMRPRSSPVRNS
jgi:hypothetical protein